MKMKRLLLIIGLVLAVANVTNAKMDLVTLPKRDTVQLTIYNSTDLTLVRESRALTLKEGPNKLQFSWANTLIDPTSLEMLPMKHAGEIDIMDLTYPPRVKNLGIWNIKSGIGANVPVEITYLTSGLSWRAFYMGTLTKDEKTMRLQGYVRVTNKSGEDYANAQTRLIVGKVHILEQIADLARRENAYGRPGQRLSFEGMEARPKAEQQKRRRSRSGVRAMKSADMRARRKEVVKEGLSEYFLYTIEGTETIANDWSKRLLSFDVGAVPVINLYKYEQQRYGDSVTRFLSFKNDKKHELGDTPIPGGGLKVYRDTDDSHLSYIGQSEFKYIPVDDDVELNLGSVADVVVKPKLMNYKTDNYKFDPNSNILNWDVVTTFEIETKNTRDIPVKIEIQRNFTAKKWQLDTKQKYEKVDHDTIKFTLEMPPKSNRQFQYTLTTPVRLTGIHTVRPGDTLSNISRRYYGSPNQWKKIRNANRQRINNPDRIALGTTLTIP